MHAQELGDYIGAESCTDFTPDMPYAAPRGSARISRHRRSNEAAVEYPPPIPFLARTNYLPSHVPWVMRRYRTSDGRLVIREERERRGEYFHVQRSGGRLVLTLIPVEEEGGGEREDGEGEEKIDFQWNAAVAGEDGGGGDKRMSGPPPEEVYFGVTPCGGFGVSMGGLRPPVRT